MKGCVIQVMKDYESLLIAVDNGFYATKVCSRKDNMFSFRSKFELANDSLNENNTYKLLYDGKEYLVGEGASIDNREYDKTNNELHKICTITALALCSNFTGVHFNLVVGYPLNLYSSNKEIFKDYIMSTFNDGMVDVLLNYETKKFIVDDCIVLPQGAGSIYSSPHDYKNELVAVIDIGGLTVNGCIFDNLNIVRSSIFTEKLGMFSLRNKIKKVLDNRYNIDLKDYELEYVINKGLKDEPESLELIRKVKLQHVHDIRKVMLENGYNIDYLKLKFIGGGSICLQKEIREVIGKDVSISNSVYDNVLGYYKAGAILYGKKNV